MNRYVCFALLLITSSAFAQELPKPAKVQEAFAANTRSADGKPGKTYW